MISELVTRRSHPKWMREQRVLNHDLRHRIGRMCELERKTDVARGVDLPVGRLERRVDGYPGLVECDARCFETQSLYVGCSSDSYENVVDHDLVIYVVGRVVDDLLFAASLDGSDACPKREHDTIAAHLFPARWPRHRRPLAAGCVRTARQA